jgi:hypothetical protein
MEEDDCAETKTTCAKPHTRQPRGFCVRNLLDIPQKWTLAQMMRENEATEPLAAACNSAWMCLACNTVLETVECHPTKKENDEKTK